MHARLLPTDGALSRLRDSAALRGRSADEVATLRSWRAQFAHFAAAFELAQRTSLIAAAANPGGVASDIWRYMDDWKGWYTWAHKKIQAAVHVHTYMYICIYVGSYLF